MILTCVLISTINIWHGLAKTHTQTEYNEVLIIWGTQLIGVHESLSQYKHISVLFQTRIFNKELSETNRLNNVFRSNQIPGKQLPIPELMQTTSRTSSSQSPNHHNFQKFQAYNTPQFSFKELHSNHDYYRDSITYYY